MSSLNLYSRDWFKGSWFQTHGVLNAVSWGVLMPTGAVIARYLKVFKSTGAAWFYLHVTCQASAYIVGVAGLGTGLKLGDESAAAGTDTHKALGIILVALGTLQVNTSSWFAYWTIDMIMWLLILILNNTYRNWYGPNRNLCDYWVQVFALFLRPNPNHKYRFYWNVYHHVVGYATIIISIVNIFKGFSVLENFGDYNNWKHAYIGIIGALGGIAVFLEVFTWIVVLKRRRSESKMSYGNGVNGENGVNGYGNGVNGANGVNVYGSRPRQVQDV